MTSRKFLMEEFEAHRARLISVAYRMLSSRAEAEDAVQEVWLRLARSDAQGIDNVGGWLTTVVARLCLDMLRARKSRREDSIDDLQDGVVRLESSIATVSASPEDEIAMADSVGLAMLAVLEMLTPGERVAFVLHDMFAVPFDEIAPIVGRTPEAARQLASRARRRFQREQTERRVDNVRRREVVDAFLAAARRGDFEALLTLLDPDVVMRGDAAAARLGGHAELRGSSAVAEFFKGSAQAARPALMDGIIDVAVVPGDHLLVVLRFEILDGRIAAIEAVADPSSMAELDVMVLED